MKPMLPIFLSNLVETKQNNLIVEAMKSKVSTHITSNHTTKHNVAREFLGTLVTITLVFSKDANAKMVAKNLGLSKKCVYWSLQRCLQIEDGALDFWTNIKKTIKVNCTFNRNKFFYHIMVEGENMVKCIVKSTCQSTCQLNKK